MAKEHAGCEVLQQSFFSLALPPPPFDGIFANASLFHVPRAVLPRVLATLYEALVPGGVLFCSNPRSFDEDVETWDGGRYGSFLSIESWIQILAAADFMLERQYLRPAERPPSEQPWLAMVWRKPSL
jgi:SAM-dependent methyltransferase